MRFRFIDRVVSFEKGELSKLVTAKLFPNSFEFVEGHPHRPGEVPTCLVIEAIANASVRLVYSHTDERAVGVLLKVDEINIFASVYAGQEIVVHTGLVALQPEVLEAAGLARTRGEVRVGERVVADARMVLLCFPRHGFEGALPW
ncbi:MAG TPA: hypothetical protein VGB25_07335 [Candidatus Binatia bacterium]